MADQLSLSSALLVAATVYVLWRTVRVLVGAGPLRNIPGPPPGSWISGNLRQYFNRASWPWVKQVTDTYGLTSKFYGPLGRQGLQTSDPRALHSILLRDQASFGKSDDSLSLMKVLIGPGLVSARGEPHRRQRKMLNPVFSGGHMRRMTPIFYDIAHKLREAIAARVQSGQAEIDILGWMGRTALELVGQGGLGYSFDPLVRDDADAYGEAIKLFFPTLTSLSILRFLLPFAHYMGPPWFRRMILERIPSDTTQRMKMITDTMYDRSVEIFQAKKKALESGDATLLEQIGEGRDVMSILLRANLSADEDDRLADDELIAQMSTFALAGMDTTSNGISRILHILSQKPDYQEKLRAEIQGARALHGGDVPYDELMQLPLLDAVCRETLRLHAPVRVSTREAMKDTILPLSVPVRTTDGKLLSELHVPKGTMFLLNIIGSNRNKQIWGEDADEWKPERWLGELPRTLLDAPVPGIYSHLMTFSGGSHACIGFKFSQLEMKVVLAVLLQTFKFELGDKPIVWNFSAVEYPTVGPESPKPEMPLVLSLLAA